MDAIPTGAATHGHDQIAGHGLLVAALYRNQANGAAKDERITQVTPIKADRTVDRGNPHSITVVPHAGHHTLHDFFGMQDPRRQRFRRRVWRGKTENIGIADWFRAQAGAQGIADDATDPRICAAIRLDGRGVIVRLHFEADVEAIIKANNAATTMGNWVTPSKRAIP